MTNPTLAAAPPAAPAPQPTPAGKPGEPTPAPSGGTPTPAAPQPGASPAPAPGAKPDGQTMVPITALHEEREKRQQLQAELESLRKIASPQMLFDANGNPVQAAPQQQPQQIDPNVQVRQEIEKLWDSDPRKAVQAEISMAFGWYDRMNAELDAQEDAVAAKYPDFNNFRSDVRRYVRTLPLDQRRPGIVELAFFAVRGQKLDSVIERERAEMLRRMQAGELAQGLTPGAGAPAPSSQQSVQLTEDQRKACAALGISEADYIANMRR